MLPILGFFTTIIGTHNLPRNIDENNDIILNQPSISLDLPVSPILSGAINSLHSSKIVKSLNPQF